MRSLTEQYAEYLDTYQRIVRAQVEDTLTRDIPGAIQSFGIREDGRGVWAEIVIELRGVDKLYRRRTLVIDAASHPPPDPADFAATLFATNAVEEELVIPRLRKQWIEND
ncbi:hypothetical protein DSC45_23570 [Streptomyces sp. YIM 130001]|uniref:hypothetical protein n=1 Tax=Streptomyces sp. YIM 130001 TaxID=2259644 RepID=UPI000E64A3DE|nr:hypothetical protein [Streptomyces sp. YIM 130001]RII13332.1 hypothetical protein DSC45_23570 [Streptomyces sp. YIM 130001]